MAFSTEQLCLVCSKKFISYRKEAKYCSRQCYHKSTMKGIYRKCLQCDAPVYAPLCYLQNPALSKLRKFCSLTCLRKFDDSLKVTAICKQCKKPFTGSRRRILVCHKKFCSWKCYQLHHRVLYTKCVCRTCHKVFYLPPSDFRGVPGRGSYCSEKCKVLKLAKPNKMELKLDKLLRSILPGEYHLNVFGDVIIDHKVPDFINVNGQKKIIELFGEYWHPPSDEARRKRVFKKFGYFTLVVWVRELRDEKRVTKKLLAFNEKEMIHHV